MKKNEHKILAVIPARGGSKGLPKKNIKPLCGNPLIYYSIKAALDSKYVGRTVVSTEDREIASIARKYGAEIVERPQELAKDDTPSFPVFKHALTYLENKFDYRPDILVILQPTSPLRTTETINDAIKTFFDNFDIYDSLIPLYPIESKIGTIEKGTYHPHYTLGQRRQEIQKLYKECGTIFIFKPELIENGKNFGEKILPFIINNYEESIDIDTIKDLEKAEYFLRKRNENR